MKIIKNWRKKSRVRWQSGIRKQYRKEFELKLQKEIDIKDAAIKNIHVHYKSEIHMVRRQEGDKWKALLEERDDEITKLRENKENIREAVKKFEKMKQDFEETFTVTRLELESAGNYIKKGQQKLLTGSVSWERFSDQYKKTMPKVQDKLMEE